MTVFNDSAAYDLNRPAPVRLATLRAYARRPGWVRPMDWRAARFSNLRAQTGLSRGFGEGGACWSTFDAGAFTRQEWADEIEGAAIRHSGWYMDAECLDMARGLVVALPRGRFLAGYHLSQNGEFIYLPTVYDCPKDAAIQADQAASSAADEARDYAERARRADRMNDELHGLRCRLAELHTLCRYAPKAKSYRAEARLTLARIRDRRQTLRSEFSDVL